MKNSTRLFVCLLIVITLLVSACSKVNTGDESSAGTSQVSDASSINSDSSGNNESSFEGTGEESHESNETSSYDNEYLRSEVDFKDITYERPDFEEILNRINLIESLYENRESPASVKEAFDILDNQMWQVSTAYSLLNVLQSLDTSDEEIADEIILISDEFTNIKQLYFGLAVTLLDSNIYDGIFEDLTQAEKEEIRFYALFFDDEMADLISRKTQLENQYKDPYSLMVSVEGTEMTLAEVEEKYGYGSYIAALNVAGGSIYLELAEIYKTMAERAGYDNFADFAYKTEYNRDYTLEDSQKLHEYVKEYIAPLFNRLAEELPEINTSGSNSPFDYEEILTSYFSSVSPDMSKAYEYMKKHGLYSIGSGSKRRPGAFTTFLHSYDIPFIFQNTNNNYTDIETFIHEFGHFYAYYLNGDNTDSFIDIAEIHSQANELLFLPYFEDIYGSEAYEDITLYTMLSQLNSIVTGCLIDEFEQGVYSGNYNTVEELNALFASLCEEYSLINYPDYIWTTVQHIFLSPCYYISYTTSLIPALEIYTASLENRETGIEMYNSVLSEYVNCTGFMDLLTKSGFSNPFSEETIISIANSVFALN